MLALFACTPEEILQSLSSLNYAIQVQGSEVQGSNVRADDCCLHFLPN